ncbi:VOC family protein [Sphingomonas sp. KR1UV-12]|uniref:VOC family protein n=1 Tax=Sphingomonas aurea TaxID=3063994 RepID=A0ABT9EKU3_9SPHN|nr:VOC family protein [Sphingomonas sp. KR1UV-12]MDP1027403.1 VOC family protein [Sphingomonas sp. KR1UV-12]
MFSHVTLGMDDAEATRRFYDAVLGTIGVPPGVTDERGRLVYSHDGGRLLITRPVDGQGAAAGNGHTLGFLMPSPEAADAWHTAGVANGGTTCEDPPGIRQATGGRVVYLAYLRDPAGNKLCAFHRIS